jgi:hypothetical protein
MRSIRTFAYAAVLSLSMFSIQPTLAAAEDAHGVFTLAHEVHWQNHVLRPGDYAFSVKTSGPPTFLMLRSLNGTGTDAILLVTDVESPQPNATSKLSLVSKEGQSFVSTMDLPQFDISLRFAVPAGSSSK